ncbi:RNA polymerase sigma factor [Actinophytocola sp. NPDC049390]|uniref:RNA polymerase sigma factor n=1 Tax=Actinophytocola sp. NPDC049390 TaxID=3363894 RepID=UPI0037A8575A
MTLDRRSDAELIAAVRRGDSAAYGALYERHLQAAKRAASCLSGTLAEREDLVADAFTRVLRVLRDGRGPTEEFRAYLLVTLRNAAISGARGATVSLYADVPETYLPRSGGDPVVHRWDANAAASAFASLPERWRTVLWHTEVEEESPAEIAPLLGLRPNGVAALAYRAREGLRQAYLRAHLADVEGRECRATVSKLAGWVRRSVPDPLGRKISRHLARCADCRARADTLATVNAELRSSVAPLLLGASLAAAYLPAAAPATVAKTLVAKAAAVIAIAATAVTTVASAPENGGRTPLAHVPALANPTSAAETVINGPLPSMRPPVHAGRPAVVEPAPAEEAPSAVVPTRPSTVPPKPPLGNTKAEEQVDANEDRQAEKKAAKEAAKEARKTAKAEEKPTKNPTNR